MSFTRNNKTSFQFSYDLPKKRRSYVQWKTLPLPLLLTSKYFTHCPWEETLGNPVISLFQPLQHLVPLWQSFATFSHLFFLAKAASKNTRSFIILSPKCSFAFLIFLFLQYFWKKTDFSFVLLFRLLPSALFVRGSCPPLHWVCLA